MIFKFRILLFYFLKVFIVVPNNLLLHPKVNRIALEIIQFEIML